MARIVPHLRPLVPIFLTLLRGTEAQTSAPPATFRINTQLVEVSVSVRDAQGNPVRGLKPGDFEVYDGAKKQEIRVFRAEDFTARPPAPAGPPAAAPGSSEPGVFSNRVRPAPGAPNPPTVIVIDAGNTWDRDRMTWADLVYARDQLVKFNVCRELGIRLNHHHADSDAEACARIVIAARKSAHATR